jgi:peptide/nickel transport system permease protein
VNAIRIVAAVLLAAMAFTGLFATSLVPHEPQEQHAAFPYAPPMRPHLIDDEGRLRWPFVYTLRLSDPLNRQYTEDRSREIPLWGSRDHPVFLLGTDALGRDVLSRLIMGTRPSLGIAIAATLGAIVLGAAIGLIAGYAKGIVDETAMRVSEVVLLLPALYVVLAIRAALPLVMEPVQVFAGVSLVLALVGWPIVARGVRAIIAVESTRDYVEAARAAGASPARIIRRHLLPAIAGFLTLQAALLLPAFVIAEATLSLAGFGFAEPTPSWGTMLQDAANVRALAEYPWLLTPAAAVALVSTAMQAVAAGQVPAGLRQQEQPPRFAETPPSR